MTLELIVLVPHKIGELYFREISIKRFLIALTLVLRNGLNCVTGIYRNVAFCNRLRSFFQNAFKNKKNAYSFIVMNLIQNLGKQSDSICKLPIPHKMIVLGPEKRQ